MRTLAVMLAIGVCPPGHAGTEAAVPAERVEGPRPAPSLEFLQMTLLIRQMVLDAYDSNGTGTLSEQDRERLKKDALAARQEARKQFMARFDKDGDGKLSPEEYKAFREYMDKRRPGHGHGKPGDGPPPPPPPGDDAVKMRMVEIRTPERKKFMVAPGLFLLSRQMLLKKYDANADGRIDAKENGVIMKDAAACYQAKMKELMDRYDLDQDGVLSPVEKEQALADSHQDSPQDMDEEPDDIDLFIKANIMEVLLEESPLTSTPPAASQQ